MATLDEVFENVAAESAEKFIRILREEIKTIFKEQAFPELKAEMLRAYDNLASQEEAQFGQESQGEDPLSLKRWRHLFEKQLDEELSKAVITDDEINIRLGTLSLLSGGDDRRGDPETVDWLIFYIEGVVGEFGFISTEQYLMRRPNYDTSRLGRFGEGFLISKEDYERERWERVTGIPFSAIKHPISGQRPYKGFERAADKVDFNKFVNIAAERAGRKLSQ